MRTLDINYQGIEMSVTGCYQREEQSETGTEAQYPGCPSDFEINEIEVSGFDIIDLISEKEIEKIKIECLENIEDY